jgi:putative restriction endonuclease
MPFDPRTLEIGRLYSRPQLAVLWGYRGYQAFARGVFTPSDGGHLVLFVTRQKQDSLTQYQDFISGDYLRWEGQKGHGTDDRVARAHERGEEIHLFYRDIHHTPFRYYGPLEIRSFVRRKEKPSEFTFRVVHDLSPEDDLDRYRLELGTLDQTERQSVVRARLGQGQFRADLVEYWQGCAVTGITASDLLRASHIKPWRNSSNLERLDRFNGLLLLPQYDHLFDRGYITFDESGRLEPSPALVSLPPKLLGIELDARLRTLAREHLTFLEHHRSEVFLGRVDAD